MHQLQHDRDYEEARIAKAKRCRDRALRELLETEKTYVDGLAKLIHIYMNPLKQDDCRIIPIADHQSIFPSVISTIYNLHNQLLAEWDYNYNYYHNTKTKTSADESISLTSKVSKVLIKYVECFKMYQLYLTSYERAQKALMVTKSKNRRFHKWLQTQQVKTSLNAGNLEDLLILPIQRIVRYPLLLREIIKQTQRIDMHHDDLTDLNKTYHEMLQITQLIENKMREYDNKRKVACVEKKFDNINAGDLIQPSRYFIYENKNKNDITIHKMDGSSYHIQLILFNDCLIYGHFNEESMSISMAMPTTFMKRKLHFDHLLPFDAVFKCVLEDNYKHLPCLLLYSREYSVWISFANNKLRAKWHKLINNTNDLVNNKHLKNLQKLYVGNKKEVGLMPYPCFVPDDYADFCQECNAKFTYISNRKHHCKQCGRLLCGTCTNYRINSFNKYKRNQIIRCCKTCKHHNTFALLSSQDKTATADLFFEQLRREKRAQSSPSIAKKKSLSKKSPHRGSQPLILNKSATSTISMIKKTKAKASSSRHINRVRKKPERIKYDKYMEKMPAGYYNDDDESFDELDDGQSSMDFSEAENENMPTLQLSETTNNNNNKHNVHYKQIKIIHPTTLRSRSYAVGILNEYVGCIITDDDSTTDQLSDIGATPSSGDSNNSAFCNKRKIERISSFRTANHANLQSLTSLIWV